MYGLHHHAVRHFSMVLIGHRATSEKIEQLRGIKWHDESLDRYSNKQRMKELGGSMFQYERFLVESSIMGTANAIESTCSHIKRELRVRWDVFKNESPSVRFHESARCMRALANIIKHNHSYIEAGSSEFADYLIKSHGFVDQSPIGFAASPHLGSYDFEAEFRNCYIYCMDLISHVSKSRRFYEDEDACEMKRRITALLLPEILGLTPPSPNQPLERTAIAAVRPTSS